MTRGVKDSLVTLSALGAAGLLAYYSLSGPTVAIENAPKSLAKRSYDGMDDMSLDNNDGMFENFSFDGDDVMMFADDDPPGDPRAGRKRKPKGNKGGAAASSEPDTAMIDWFNGQGGADAITAKISTMVKNIDRIHRNDAPISGAAIADDAAKFTNGDSMTTDSTSDAFASVAASSGVNCAYGEPNRVSETHIFAMFPEDIMMAHVNQENLHTGYVNFASSLNSHLGGNDHGSYTVGTYAANNAIKTAAYSDNFVADLGWSSLSIPAKKNRQGSYNLAATMPNMSKILTNVWKKAQKVVKRPADSQPGSQTCQVFLFMHNLPYDYKTLAQGKWSAPTNLGSRCNIVPVLLHNTDTKEAMDNVAARFLGTVNQDVTTVEPHFRGYISDDGDNYSRASSAIADGLASWSCLTEQRIGCLVKRAAWFETFDDDFRGIDEADVFTTAGTTTEMTTTTTGWTSTAPEETTAYETTAPVAADMRCCNSEAGGATGLSGSAYNANEQGCCEESDGSWYIC